MRGAAGVLVAGLGGCGLVLASLACWWELPRWCPEPVVRWSPLPSLALRASARLADGHQLLGERVEAWGPRATTDLLAAIDRDDPDLLDASLAVVARTHDLRALPSLIRCSGDARDRVALEALAAIDAFGDERTVLPLLRGCTGDVATRFAVPHYPAVEIRDPVILATCIELLHDPLPETRMRAACALRRTPTATAGRALIAAVHDRCPMVALTAARCLHADLGSSDQQIACIDDPIDPAVKVQLIRSLCDREPPGATVRSALVRWLAGHPEEAVRQAAAETLALANAVHADADLIVAFDDAAAGVRYAAVYAFCRHDNPQALPGLIRLLDDPSEAVSLCAMMALSRNCGVVAIEGLRQFVARTDQRVRRDVGRRHLEKMMDDGAAYTAWLEGPRRRQEVDKPAWRGTVSG